MTVHFVTALYIGLKGTRYNGSPEALYERYKQSLRSLAKGGYGIVCYTDNAHLSELQEFYKEYPNIQIVAEELSDFYYHDAIENIKNNRTDYMTSPSWETRCVEIMWGKFYWLMRHAALAETNAPIFWIDAGIFHSGLIHEKWKTDRSDNLFDFDRITQGRDLYADLVKHANGKLLNIRCGHPNHGSDEYIQVFPEMKRPQFGIIGGIFGGERDLVLDYASDAMDAMDRTIQAKVLLKEEEIMQFLYEKNPNKFSSFEFKTWYHEDWSDDFRRGETLSFSDYFDFLRNL